MTVKYISFLFFAFFCFTSCGLTDNDQPIPGFLELKDPVVKSISPGSNDTHKITEAWVFADGQILGIFPLPAKVPLFLNGAEQEITILAGIRNNGINDTPVFYPFYKSIVQNVNPEPNQTIGIPLVFEYVTNAKIPVNEGFETGNSFTFNIDNDLNTNIIVTGADAVLGTKSGVVTLTESLKFMEISTDGAVAVGENARGKSYIEFDYKGDGEISVGIAKRNGGIITVNYNLFVPARSEWNKIYVDVTDQLSSNDFDDYRIVFGFTKTGISFESKVFIDNVKHIHF